MRRRPAILAATGTAGGLLSGIVGGGGGAIMVPLMTGPLRMSQHTAHGTSLAIIVATATAAALMYAGRGHIDPGLTAAMVAGATVAAVLGARAARHVPALRLRQLFAAFLLAVAIRLLLVRSVDPLFDASDAVTWTAGPLIGFAGGFASGALGVGGGAIFVPALVLLLGVDQHEAQGISLWVVVAATIAGALTHHQQGTVDHQAARWMAVTAVPAGVAGAFVAGLLGARTLQMVFATILAAIGAQMLLTATRRLRREGQPPMLRAEQ